MHNLVLFCKTFIRDLDRIKTLKASVDKFNADKIPFCIVCPEAETDIFKRQLITGKEDYELIFFTDEEVTGKELSNNGSTTSKIEFLKYMLKNSKITSSI